MVMLTNDEYISEDMLVELYIYEDKDNILNNLSQYLLDHCGYSVDYKLNGNYH